MTTFFDRMYAIGVVEGEAVSLGEVLFIGELVFGGMRKGSN
jgi:hypothetical protein